MTAPDLFLEVELGDGVVMIGRATAAARDVHHLYYEADDLEGHHWHVQESLDAIRGREHATG